MKAGKKPHVPETPSETGQRGGGLSAALGYGTRGSIVVADYDDEQPLAVWEALLLPDWRWEAYEKEEENLYFGRVRSPNTYGKWEYGYFTQNQLETAGAYRIDTLIDSDEELFPDGGYDLTYVIETEFEAFQQSGDGLFGR